MNKLIASIVLASASLNAVACKDSLSFEADKQKHFAVSVALGAAGRTLSDDPYKAFAIGIAPGIAKEVYDIKYGCASVYDLAWDALGVGVGLTGTNIIIRHNFIGYKTPF